MIGNFKKSSLEEVEALKNLIKLSPHEFDEFFYHDPLIINIDKTWQVLNYLVSGNKDLGGNISQDPLANVIGAGDIVIDKDLAYGPASFLPPAEVKKVWSAIQNITKADLKKRFIPRELGGMYPEVEITAANQDEEFGYFTQSWDDIKKLYQAAAAEDKGIFFWLS